MIEFNKLIKLETEDFTESLYEYMSEYIKSIEKKNHRLQMVDLDLTYTINDIVENYYNDIEFVFIPNTNGLFRYLSSNESTVNLDIESLLSIEKIELESDMNEYMERIKRILPSNESNKNPYYLEQIKSYEKMIENTDFKININKVYEHQFSNERVPFDEFKDFILKNELNKRCVKFLDNKLFLFKKISAHFYNLDLLRFLNENFKDDEVQAIFERWIKIEGDFEKYSFNNLQFH